MKQGKNWKNEVVEEWLGTWKITDKKGHGLKGKWIIL